MTISPIHVELSCGNSYYRDLLVQTLTPLLNAAKPQRLPESVKRRYNNNFISPTYINKYNTTTKSAKEERQKLRLMFGYQLT